MSKKAAAVISVLFLLAGIGLLGYPLVSNWLLQKNATTAIDEYVQLIEEMDDHQMEEERQRAEEYNDMLSGSNIKDPFIPESGMTLPEDYLSILNIDGTMGYVDIPSIDVYLPVYHGTSEEVLRKGIGHLDGTALPVGGEGNHVVLTGHSALASAKLFTDLEEMQVGDQFYLHVLDEVLAYQVDQITVIEPEETEVLRAVKGEDYVTLITCTPYAINSHRLLVRGTRIPYEPGTEQEVSADSQTKKAAAAAVIAVAVIGTAAAAGFIWKKRRKKQ